MRSVLTLAVVTLAGCGGSPENPFQWTEDVRVDAAAEANDPDSSDPHMCVTDEGHVFVLWSDDRGDPGSEQDALWMNRSIDKGASWLPAAVRVNQGDGAVTNADLACSEAGVFVVWEDDRDGELHNGQIYFQRSEDGELFMPDDVLLESDPDGLSMSKEPKLTVNGADLFVVWFDDTNGAYDILLNSSTDAGQTWRDPVRVDSDDPPGSAFSAMPQVAVSDNSQDVWVTWQDRRDGKTDIYFARSDTGGLTFKPDERLDLGDDGGQYDSFEPQLCTDGGDHLYVVWHDTRNGEGDDIFMNYSSNQGADWLNNAVRLDSDNAGFSNSLHPACVASGATLHVAWQDDRDQGYDIYYRQIDGGIVLDSQSEVRADLGNPAGFANSVEAQIALYGETVVLAWRDGRGVAELGSDNDYDDLYYQFSTAGAPFEPETDYRIDSMHPGQSYKTDLNLEVLGGELYAAWTDGRSGTSDIYFQRHVIGEQAVAPPTEDELAAFE